RWWWTWGTRRRCRGRGAPSSLWTLVVRLPLPAFAHERRPAHAFLICRVDRDGAVPAHDDPLDRLHRRDLLLREPAQHLEERVLAHLRHRQIGADAPVGLGR